MVRAEGAAGCIDIYYWPRLTWQYQLPCPVLAVTVGTHAEAPE